MDLQAGQHVFMAGIGGVSMSGLAHGLLEMGFVVSGSDLVATETTAKLQAAGATVHIGHAASHIAGADVVVRSTAILDSNPEIVAAHQAGVPVYHRSELLAWMCRGKRAIAITGTHGKSTTTAMAATIFLRAGIDATVFVGADMPLIGGNHHLGQAAHMIFEACESDNTFLHYANCSEVITSCEPDHLDQHQTFENLRRSFARFAELADPEGFVVYNGDCACVGGVVTDTPARKIAFSVTGHGEIVARNIRLSGEQCQFDLVVCGEEQGSVRLPVPGEHNVRNALAALGCALGSGLDLAAACAALAEYQPIGRRFQEVFRGNGVRIVDDYAHHPTEIAATLATARAVHQGRIIAVFQPHLRSRTRDLLHEFGKAFHDADVVVLTDIYQPREDGLETFDVARLQDEVRVNEPGKPVELVRDKAVVAAQLAPQLRDGDLVLTIGAGDVWRVGKELSEAIAQGARR